MVDVSDQAAPRLITDLPPATCRFAVDSDAEGRWLFCGAATADVDVPFCAHHAAIAYVPRAERKKLSPGRWR